MEYNEISALTDVRRLIDCYTEIALTSKSAVDISPMPGKFSCYVTFPPNEQSRFLQFCRDYVHALVSKHERVSAYNKMLQDTHVAPHLLYHPLSTMLIVKVGDGFAGCDILQRDVEVVSRYMQDLCRYFDASPSSEPQRVERRDPIVSLRLESGERVGE